MTRLWPWLRARRPGAPRQVTTFPRPGLRTALAAARQPTCSEEFPHV